MDHTASEGYDHPREYTKALEAFQATTILKRDGDRALRGRMALLGEGYHRVSDRRTITVRIYRCEAGGYAVARITEDQPDYWAAHEAWTADDPEALLTSLRGQFLPAEQKAWEAACEADPDLAAIRYEEV